MVKPVATVAALVAAFALIGAAGVADAASTTPCAPMTFSSPLFPGSKLCVGQTVHYLAGRPGDAMTVTIFFGLVPGRAKPGSLVRVVETLPARSRPISIDRAHTLVGDKVIWRFVDEASGAMQFFNVTLRLDANAKFGDRWCNRVEATVVGFPHVYRSAPACFPYAR